MMRAWNHLIHRLSGFSAAGRTLAGRPAMAAAGAQAASA